MTKQLHKKLNNKVRIYWNLHKKVWSVQSCKSGLVIDHKQYLTLEDAKFVVRKGGQKQVREQGKKNVHAFAVGYIANEDIVDKNNSYTRNELKLWWNRVKYNPYTDDYFMQQNLTHEWDEIPRDWLGYVHMESLVHPYGVSPRVYI